MIIIINMYDHHNLYFSAWSLQEGQYELSTYSLQPNHLSFTIFACVSLNGSSFLELERLFSLHHHSVGLYFVSQQLELWISYCLSIIYEYTHCHTHKHMQILQQYTASTTRISGVECCCTGETLSCNIPAFNWLPQQCDQGPRASRKGTSTSDYYKVWFQFPLSRGTKYFVQAFQRIYHLQRWLSA